MNLHVLTVLYLVIGLPVNCTSTLGAILGNIAVRHTPTLKVRYVQYLEVPENISFSTTQSAAVHKRQRILVRLEK